MSIQCDIRWQTHCMNIHHNNLASIKPTFSTRSKPQQAQPKRKDVKRETDIVRENKRLLDSLKFIISHPSESDLGQDCGQTKQSDLRKSNLKLIQNKRKKQQQYIQSTNQNLYKRIKELPAVYSASQWQHEYDEHRYLLRRLERPLVPVSNPLPSEMIGTLATVKDLKSPRFSATKPTPLLRPHQLKKLKYKKSEGKSSAREIKKGTLPPVAQSKTDSVPQSHPIESPSPEKYKMTKK